MTAQADIIRDRRRAFAAPGGFHDHLIAFLARALPAGIGVIAAVMILVPLSQRGEISFLLDRNKVAVTDQRLVVDTAMYRGQDDHGRKFELDAARAVQQSARIPVVELSDLVATIAMTEGPAKVAAGQGSYNFQKDQVDVAGPVNFTAADGYKMVTNNVSIDLKSQMAVGSGGVSGTLPSGTFRADSIVADMQERTVALEGNAHVRMVPGQLRIPQ